MSHSHLESGGEGEITPETAFHISFHSLDSRPPSLSGRRILVDGDTSHPILPMKMVQAHESGLLYRVSIALWASASLGFAPSAMNVNAKVRETPKHRDLVTVAYRLQANPLGGETVTAEVTRLGQPYGEEDLAFLRAVGLADIALRADQIKPDKPGVYVTQYFPVAEEIAKVAELPELTVAYSHS